jgi:hypothetical protein
VVDKFVTLLSRVPFVGFGFLIGAVIAAFFPQYVKRGVDGSVLSIPERMFWSCTMTAAGLFAIWLRLFKSAK